MRTSWIVVFLVGLAVSPALLAQSASGTILGSVHDATGASIPGAIITVVNQHTGFRREVPADSNGDYEFPYVPLGEYVVSAKAKGFKAVDRAGVTLVVDQKARIEFTLTIGDVNETVTVTEAAPLVKADSSEMGEVVQQKTVQNLPLNGRNYVQLVFLTAGVTTGQQGGNIEGTGAFVQRGTGSFNANGQRGQNNNFMVDGIDNNESWINTTILQPAVEATREFKVYTANAPAEFGRASGGMVNVQTRSGTNQFHGSAFEYLRNAALDARNFYQRKTPQDQRRIPNFVQSQFGASFGGPIIHNNWFIFGDYSGFRQALGLDITSTLPSVAQKAGNFGATNIYDPITTRADPANAANFIRDQFPNNIIPANRIPSQARALMNLYPDPNVAGTAVNNYFFSPSKYQTDDAFNIRSDKIISLKNTLFTRVSRGRDVTNLPGALPASTTVDVGPYAAADNTQGADSADFKLVTWGGVLSDTHVFRSNLVNEFRIGFSRFDLHALPKNMFINAAAAIGIPGINDALPPYSGGLIGVRPTGFQFLGNITPIPSISQNTNYQLSENLTHIMGRHSMKYGFQVIRRHLNFFESQDPARGFFNFDSTFTNLPSTGAGGNTIASMLLGYPARITRTTLRGVFGLRAWEYSLYAQDDFKVNNRLTLNLGLRYELFPPLTEVEGRIANFNFDPTNPALSNIANVTGDKYAGRKIDPWNFAPRVGFAYSLTSSGRTVLRGSYGMHYVSVHYAGQGAIGRNPPFMPTQDFQPGSLFVGRNIADGLPLPVPTPLDTAAKLNAAGGSIYAVQLDTHTPRAQQYNFDIEHQLTSGLLLDIGYVGTHGSHLFSTYNLNLPVPGPTPLAARRPIQLLNNLPTINYFGFFGDSVYQGLQTKVSKRFSHGLEFLATYTWAKSIDNAIAGSSGQRGRPNVSAQYQDINNIRSARGLSSFDLAHRFVFSGYYALPFGRDGSGLTKRILGGWQLNTIVTLQTGPPFTPVLASNGLNNGNFQLPNRIGDGAIPDNQRTIQQWFNTSINPADPNRAFSVPPAYVFGNSGYNILRGPGLKTVDMAVHKNIPLTERVKLQLRGEGFNILNQANFALPNINLGTAAAGSIGSTITTSRQIQVVAKVEF